MQALEQLPFDHFQRYAPTAEIIRASGNAITSVLEVGANRQRLLGAILPDHACLYTDIEPQGESADFVVADARNLPFEDKSHDAVVALDVLEHIPVEFRRIAMQEMARTAKRLVVVCCPTDTPWARAADRDLNAMWDRFFGEPYPWLREHDEFGLVVASDVWVPLEEAGFTVMQFGQGNPALWAALMRAHFAKEVVPELAATVAAADRIYNTTLATADRGERSYRQFFVGFRDMPEPTPPANHGNVNVSAVQDALEALGAGLVPVVDRIVRSEREWSAAAGAARKAENALARLSSQYHALGLQLEESERRAAEQLQRGDTLAEQLARSENRAVEQLNRGNALADQLEQATLMARAKIEELETRYRESEKRAVEQLQRGDASDRNAMRLANELADLHADSLVAKQNLLLTIEKNQALEASYASVLEDVDCLQQRICGLERRQRTILAAAGFLATICIIVFLKWKLWP